MGGGIQGFEERDGSLGAIAGVELRKVLWRGSRWRVFDGARGLLRVAVTVGEVLTDDDVRAFHRAIANRARVVHPGLARILSCGVEDGLFFQVSALPEGPRLSQRVRTGAMLEDEIRNMIRQLAGALHAAHRLGVVVGQVTPDTLLLTPSGVKICDIFPWLHYRTGPFSAPETEGLRLELLDHHADIFSLGAVAWFAVTGRPPPAPESRVSRRLDPNTFGISRGLAWLIGHLLEDDHKHRFQDMVEVLDALDQVEVAGEHEPEVLQTEGTAHADEPFEVPLVGREQTLAALERFRVAAREDSGYTVVVSGPPGAGRTRLLYEMARRAQAAGDLVLYTRCEKHAHTPLAAFRRLVDEHIARLSGDDPGDQIHAATDGIADLLRGFSPLLDHHLPGTTSERGLREPYSFFAALAQFVQRLGESEHSLLPDHPLSRVVQGGAVSEPRASPMMIVIDDAQWLDDASVQVLRCLAVGVQARPMILLLGARDTGGSPWYEQLAPAQLQLVPLGPMTATEVGALCRAIVWYPLAPRIVALIIARTGGHALSVVAFVQAMLDEGVLLPNWGEWDVDMNRFGELALPGVAEALVTRRVAAFDTQIREVLATAACLGRKIDIPLLASLCGNELVHAALLACSRSRLTVRRGRRVAFAHQQVVDVLLAGHHPDELARIHGLIARYLCPSKPRRRESETGTDRADPPPYRAAFHAQRSSAVTQAPEFVIDLLLQTGRAASRGHAPQAARVYLQQAQKLMHRMGKVLRRADATLLGHAYAKCGQLDRACEALEHALSLATSPLQRAKLRVALARVNALGLRTDRIRTEVEYGLSTLKAPPLRGHIARRATALISRTFRARVTRRSEKGDVPEIDRGKVLLQLLELGGQAAYLSREFGLGLQLASRAYTVAQRLPPCPEQARAIMTHSVGLAATGRTSGFASESNRALELALKLGDRSLEAGLLAARAMGHEILGNIADAELDLRKALELGAQRLPVEQYASCALSLARSLDQRGYPAQATSWVAQARLRLQLATRGGLPHFHSVLAYAACLDAACGRHEQAQESLDLARAALRSVTTRGAARVYVEVCSLRVLYESRAFDADYDRAAAMFMESMPTADPLIAFSHDGFLLLAFGELERAIARHRMNEASIDTEFADLRTAIGRLAPLRNVPLVSLHSEWIEATYRWLRGETATAHRRWSDAAKRAHRLDCPRVLAQISRFRAYALNFEGARESGLREAKNAASIAKENGLVTLEMWIREDFQLGDVSHRPDSADTVVSVGTVAEQPSLRIRQHFDTLLQIRMSALRQSSPASQAKAILHELMLVLGASRAWMLAYADLYPELKIVYGCTVEGRELRDLDPISRGVIEQTRDTGELSIGSGPADEDAEATTSALWSTSSRSLMAVPIRLGERMIGIVCLDNRMSGNAFSRADEQMLQAMSGHIALAGELLTARLKAQSEATNEAMSGVLEKACRTLSLGVMALARNGSLVHVSETVAELTSAWAEPPLWWRDVTETGIIDPTWVGLGDGAHHVVSVELRDPNGDFRVFELSFTGEVHPLVGFGEGQVVFVADTTSGSHAEIELRAIRDAAISGLTNEQAELRSRKSLREQLGALLTTVCEELDQILDDPEQRRERIAGLLDVVSRVSRVSRIESGQLPLSNHPIDLSDLVNQVHLDVRPGLVECDGDLLIDLRTLDAIASDRVLLRQILGELVVFIAGGCARPDVLLEVWIDRHGDHPVCVFEISRPRMPQDADDERNEIGQLALSVTQHAVGLLRGTLQLHASTERRILTFTLPVGGSSSELITMTGR